MKKLTTLLFSLICLTTFAQVGIETTNPKASLDIKATNQATPTSTDGILIPRIDNFPAINPAADQNGMLVFLTTDNKFYYWKNSINSWVNVLSGAQKIDDLIDGKSDNDGSNNGSSVFLGYQSGSSDDLTDNKNVGVGFNSLQRNTNGWGNNAIGYNSLRDNTTGLYNVAIGISTLMNNSVGEGNIAIGFLSQQNSNNHYNTSIGHRALEYNTNGNNNVAIGSGTMRYNQGSYNSAIGNGSLLNNTLGDFNTSIGTNSLGNNIIGNNNLSLGYQSGYGSLGTGNVFLGHKSGYNETGDNKLYIENTDSDSDNALIYGEFGSDNTTVGNVLRTNSSFQIGNPTTTGYAFPTIDGAENQILKTNGSGTLGWQDGTNNFSMVSAFITNGGLAYNTLGNNTWEVLEFDAEEFDANNEFDLIANKFVALKAGYYQIEAQFTSEGHDGKEEIGIGIYVNNNIIAEQSFDHTGDLISNAGGIGARLVCRKISKLVYLNTNDYVQIQVKDKNTVVTIDKWKGKTFFTIQRVR